MVPLGDLRPDRDDRAGVLSPAERSRRDRVGGVHARERLLHDGVQARLLVVPHQQPRHAHRSAVVERFGCSYHDGKVGGAENNTGKPGITGGSIAITAACARPKME